VILGSSGPGAMQAAAARIGAGIESLAAAGARHFLVANAPDVGRVYGNPLLNPPFAQTATPFGEANRAILTGLSLEFNAALAGVLGSISVESLVAIDVLGSFDAVIDDPEAFGFSQGAVDSDSQSRAFPIACLADPACAADPQGQVADGFLVFDSVHPTTALHRRIADGALAAVVPEPSTAACLALGLAMLAGQRGARSSGAARPVYMGRSR
jgi:phospholipase/lecithinase/hemolysin